MDFYFLSKGFHQIVLINPLDYVLFPGESSNFKLHCEHNLRDFCGKCIEKELQKCPSEGLNNLPDTATPSKWELCLT